MKLSMHTIVIADFPQPEKFLLYSTRTQAMVVIDREIKWLLDHYGENGCEPLEEQYAQQLMALHKMGIVSQDEQEDVLRLKAHMQQLKSKVNPTGLAITILTTYACNLKCTYCFEESSRTVEKMIEPTADAVMDWIKFKMKEQGYQLLYLNFYGGEPLLNQPILEKIASQMQAWCESQGLGFKFMIQTNGYLMTPELIQKYLAWGLTQVRVSLDGVAEVHDRMRPLRGGGGSFQRIIKNIEDCCDLVKIGISTSFTQGEITHIEGMLSDMNSRGILYKLGRFIFSPLHPTLGPNGRTEQIQNAHCECNLEDSALVESNRKIRALLQSYGLEQKSGMSISVCPLTREESGGTIDQQGRLFRCNSMLGHPELSTGHVRELGYNQRHRAFVGLDVYDQCPQDCTYMPMCSGGCRLTAFLKTKNFRTPSCHKAYLNMMAPEIIKKEYQDKKARSQLTFESAASL